MTSAQGYAQGKNTVILIWSC